MCDSRCLMEVNMNDSISVVREQLTRATMALRVVLGDPIMDLDLFYKHRKEIGLKGLTRIVADLTNEILCEYDSIEEGV